MSHPFDDGVKLEMLRRYKYLGYFITLSGEINTDLKQLSFSFSSSKHLCKELGRTPLNLWGKLFSI